jgi:hypothetical protein
MVAEIMVFFISFLHEGVCMNWTPTKPQLELLAEHAIARTPPAKVAAILGIDEATFEAWSARLAAMRALTFEEIVKLCPMPDIGRARREHARMQGERLFESETPEDEAA